MDKFVTRLDAQFRPFTAGDWIGLSGAEKFSSGEEPMIAEWNDADETLKYSFVVDKNGFEIIVSRKVSGNEWRETAWYKSHSLCYKYAKALAELIKSDREQPLVAWGFVRI